MKDVIEGLTDYKISNNTTSEPLFGNKSHINNGSVWIKGWVLQLCTNVETQRNADEKG